MKKRIICLVLCFVMVFSLLPMSGFATKYEITYAPHDGPWTEASATAQTYYALGEDGSYYPVYVKDNPGELFFSSENVTLAVDSSLSKNYYYYNAEDNAYYPVYTENGMLYKYYKNSFKIGDEFRDSIDRAILGTNYTYGAVSDHNLYYYRPNDKSIHLVYYNGQAVVTIRDVNFHSTLYYFNETETNPGSALDTDTKYTTALRNKTISRLKNGTSYTGPDYASVTWDYSFWDVFGIISGDNYSGSLYQADRNGTRYLRYDRTATGEEGVELGHGVVYDTNIFEGQLYYVDTTGTSRTLYYKDANDVEHPLGSAQSTGSTIYTGQLYTKIKTPLPPEPAAPGEMHTNKTLTRESGSADPGSYSVNLEVYSTGNQLEQKEETESVPLDVALVIDQSSSMSTGDMSEDYEKSDRTEWTVGQATEKQYFYKDGGKYYPVQAETGTVYTPVEDQIRPSDMFGWGHDGISLGVNGAPTHYNVPTKYLVKGTDGKLHPLFLITAGLFMEYGLYPYIYTDPQDTYNNKKEWTGNNYWVAVFDPWDGSDLRDNDLWNTLTKGENYSRISFIDTNGNEIAGGSTDSAADKARLSYSWITSSKKMSGLYQASESKAPNRLYYINDAGQKMYLGSTAQRESDVVYNCSSDADKLWYANGKTRVEALQESVEAFAKTLAVNGKDAGVTHRVAIAGFASGKVPQSFSDPAMKTAVDNTTYHYDYADTGLFLPSGNSAQFKNYATVKQNQFTEHTGTRYVNRHYYIQSGGNYVPVLYNTSNGHWYNITNDQEVSSSATFYDATYEGLSDSDYLNALMPVNEDETSSNVNPSLLQAIGYFGCYGGTYTSYGMNIAEQIFNVSGYDGTYQDKDGHTKDRKKVIVVFTDGEPGANGYEPSIAGEALVSSNIAKDAGVEVFTVGLFKGNPSAEAEQFMKRLSSETTMELSPVYGGTENYGLGSGSNALKANETYYYIDESTGKAFAVTTERGGESSLGWWVSNTSGGKVVSWSPVEPKTSTGAGNTIFYDKNGNTVQGDNVKEGTVYYNDKGDKINYEYRWYDSERSVIIPASAGGGDGTQLYAMTNVQSAEDGKSYYLTASNLAGLQSVFATITQSVLDTTTSGVDQWNDDNTFVVDEISSDFDLPEITAENNHVTVWSERITMDEDGEITFTGEKTELPQVTAEQYAEDGNGVVVTWEGKKVTVRGFDFARNYVAEDHEGQRLLIKIDGLVPNKAGEPEEYLLYSNTSQAGVYTSFTDEDTEETITELVKPFERPSYPVPGYDVVWMNEGEELDKLTNILPGKEVNYSGPEPQKEADEDYIYTFKGFKDDDNNLYEPLRDDAGNITGWDPEFPVMANHDVTYTAQYDLTEIQKYNVIWKNYDETVLETDENVPTGEIPSYDSALPSRDSVKLDNGDETTYFFAGWSYDKNGEIGGYDADGNYTGDLILSFKEVEEMLQDAQATGNTLTLYAIFGEKNLKVENVVVDFGTKNKIASNVYDEETIYAPGGDFSLEGVQKDEEGTVTQTGTLYFIPKMQEKETWKYDATGMSQVNTAVYYLDQAKNNLRKVNVISGSSIYLDDSIQSVVTERTPDGYGYDYMVNADLKEADVNSTSKADRTETLEFTFSGTRIDVYCTTDSATSRVMATLKDDAGNTVKSTSMGNTYTSGTLYNVPTLTFDGLDNTRTYTLTIRVIAGSYRLDGIRVFNPVKADTDVGASKASDVYGDQDKNATFISVREQLIKSEDWAKVFDSADGAVFIDSMHTGGSVANYTKLGPKNEVYLGKDQAVAFQIDASGYVDPTYMIGLSAPEGNGGKAKVTFGNSETRTYDLGVVDTYYTIKPTDEGYFMIGNVSNSDVIVSLTNLKVTGEKASGSRQVKMFMSRALMNSYAETFNDLPESEDPIVEPYVEPTIEPTEDPSVEPTTDPSTEPTIEPSTEPTVEPSEQPTTEPTGNAFSKFLSSITQTIRKAVSTLFGSISKLFGRK